MLHTRLGRTDLTVSRVALGCMSYGDPGAGLHSWTLNEEASQPFFRQAVEHIAGAMLEACARANVKIDDVDWFIPHQANQRILDGVSRRLGIDAEKVVSTVGLHGNTSAASVPLALDVAIKDGRVKQGQLILMEALGGGLTWASALARL